MFGISSGRHSNFPRDTGDDDRRISAWAASRTRNSEESNAMLKALLTRPKTPDQIEEENDRRADIILRKIRREGQQRLRRIGRLKHLLAERLKARRMKERMDLYQRRRFV